MKIRILCAGIVLAGVGALEAQAPLSMKVTPAVAFAPADLVLRARVEPDGRNRILEIVAESEAYYRSSQIQLDGERAPRTTLVEFRSVPGGFYQVSARLTGPGGKELAFATHDITVVEAGAMLR